MRIISSDRERDWHRLGAYHAGTPVRFRRAFHDKHKQDDVFIVNAVCSSYRPDDYKYTGKIAVTNLRTGDLAYVCPDRECTTIQAIVRLEEEAC